MRRAWLAPAAALALGCAELPASRPLETRIPAFHEGDRFATVGDLQPTSWMEFWRESNDPERKVVVAAIAAARPAFLAITGDLVFDGGSARAWADFDEQVAPIRDARIPVVAVPGNHEYWGGRGGLSHFLARVGGEAGQGMQVVAFGSVRLILLNTNRSEMEPGAWGRQVSRYEAELAALDRDPEVAGVLVLGHHPPYTNSTVTGDERHVQESLVPPFARAKKTLLLLSGHVHSYERYERGGKTFLVSGGGGGPRARLLAGDARRHRDDLFAGPPLRDFHFVLFTVTSAGLAAEVRGFPKGGAELRTMDRFSLPFAPR